MVNFSCSDTCSKRSKTSSEVTARVKFMCGCGQYIHDEIAFTNVDRGEYKPAGLAGD